MKSRRRHELKESSLVTGWRSAAAFVKRNNTRIAAVLFAGVVIAAIAVYAVNRSRQARNLRQMEFDALIAAAEDPPKEWLERMKALADQDGDERLAALACVAVGDEYASRIGGAGGASSSSDAAAYYNRALEQFPEQHVAAGRARYGLAKLAEDRGDLQAAREAYDAVLNSPQLAGQPVVELAKMAKERLEEIASPVEMVAARPEPPAAATQPADRTTRPAAAAADD
jgi:tetratricopeptide (TPR) repeat protein